jgi:dTDP-4-amino-4,6-dideoxygalactose transaminase
MVILPKYMHEYSVGDFFTSVNGLFHDYGHDLRKGLSKLYKNDKILFLDSGRSCLDLILKHLNLPPGSEVAIPVNVCQVVADVIIQNKLKPVLIDIDENLTMSLYDLNNKVSKSTKAVIAVHAFGNVCDMHSIMKFAKKKNLVVIEDSAQSFDGSFNGQVVCTFADYSFVSLDVTKHISSFGGGVLVTKDESFYKKVNSFLRNRRKVGMGVLFNLYAFRIFSSPFVYSVLTKHLIRGYKSLSYYKPKDMRLSRIGTALAYSQVKKLNSISKIRSSNARNFILNMPPDAFVYSLSKDRKPSYLFLPIGVNNPRNLESFLYKSYVDLPRAPPLLNSLKKYSAYHSSCPNADFIYWTLVLLPTYRRIGSRIGAVCRSIMHINMS